MMHFLSFFIISNVLLSHGFQQIHKSSKFTQNTLQGSNKFRLSVSTNKIEDFVKDISTTDYSKEIIAAIESIPSKNGLKSIKEADIVVSTGKSPRVVKSSLFYLASVVAANLQVTDNGDIIYIFPTNLKSVIQSKSFNLKLKSTLDEQVYPLFIKSLKITYGIVLLVSLVIIFSTIFIASVSSSSSNSDSDSKRSNNHRRSNSMMFDTVDLVRLMSYNQPHHYNYNPTVINADKDILQTYSPNYYSRKKSLNFLESFYSYVFGDDDPNDDYFSASLIASANYIRQKNGIIIAEELAPFLNPPLLSSNNNIENNLVGNKENKSLVVQESWILPVLTRFGGYPEVTADGENIVYVFEVSLHLIL